MGVLIFIPKYSIFIKLYTLEFKIYLKSPFLHLLLTPRFVTVSETLFLPKDVE